MATKHKRATMTARQLAEDYLAHQITRDVTRTSTRHHLNQLLTLFGGWHARRVGAAQMQAFLAAQKERGVMATTAHHRVRLWRTVLAWAVETGRLPASPLAGFRLHRPRARRIDPPTRAEATRMYKMAAPHIRRVIVLGMAAGPRIGPSELFRLTWGDVELEAGYMRMPNAAKGAKDDSRIVPIRDDILPLLREWREEDEKRACPWVIHWQGRPVRCIGHAWHQARKAAGITRRITPYSLRHAMPTEALEHGADVKAVAEVMGHADACLSAHALQAAETSGQCRARTETRQDLTVAGALQRPHRPGVLAPDHGPTDRKKRPSIRRVSALSEVSARDIITIGGYIMGRNMIAYHETGATYRDPLPPLRQTSGQRLDS